MNDFEEQNNKLSAKANTMKVFAILAFSSVVVVLLDITYMIYHYFDCGGNRRDISIDCQGDSGAIVILIYFIFSLLAVVFGRVGWNSSKKIFSRIGLIGGAILLIIAAAYLFA